MEDVGNLFENANQAMVPKSHNNRYEDDDIRVRLQDMDKVGVISFIKVCHKFNVFGFCNINSINFSFL